MASSGLALRVLMGLRPARVAAVQLATIAPTADVEDRRTATASDLAQAVVLAHPQGGGCAPRICPPRRRRARYRPSASATGTKARVSPRAFTNSGIRAPSVTPSESRRGIPGRGRGRQISTDLSCRLQPSIRASTPCWVSSMRLRGRAHGSCATRITSSVRLTRRRASSGDAVSVASCRCSPQQGSPALACTRWIARVTCTRTSPSRVDIGIW